MVAGGKMGTNIVVGKNSAGVPYEFVVATRDSDMSAEPFKVETTLGSVEATKRGPTVDLWTSESAEVDLLVASDLELFVSWEVTSWVT